MEILDIVDEAGVPTGETVERNLAHREGILHRSAHVWLVRRREGKVEILLQKRSRGKESYPGCYDISSAGHIPAGTGFAPSALRELREELGVEAAGEQLEYCGQRKFYVETEFLGQAFRDKQVSNVYLLWLDREAEEFALQQEEVEAVRWFEFAECKELVRTGGIPNCIFMEELELLEQKLRYPDMPPKVCDWSAVFCEGETISYIEQAKQEDMDALLKIYDKAKRFMARSGNPNQWKGDYPGRTVLGHDLQRHQLYVCREGGELHGAFAFILGEDATYSYIEGGAWLNDAPYGTIHRLAGDGRVHGLFAKCLSFCRLKAGNVRADTHQDNRIMQHLLEKNGFWKCGVIYLADGAPRLAYQLKD